MLALKVGTEVDPLLDSCAILAIHVGLFLSLLGSNVWLLWIWLLDFGG